MIKIRVAQEIFLNSLIINASKKPTSIDNIPLEEITKITTKPNDSEATLIDGKYVQFKGKKTRIYDWGLQVTGWSSIRIYQYAAIAGENETLQDKRIAFIKAEN